MSDVLSPAARAIFAKKVLAHVATLGQDGAPQVTPVWTMLDGDDVIINTALGRAKARNLANDARVAISLTDPDDQYSVIAIRGSVVGFTTEGADEVIDALAKKYLDLDSYPMRTEGEVRVTVRIQTDRISQQPQG
ncbi:MAG: PPOX class F420-dependent oxidoreductase [Actinomycetota bacterium]|jgi:PPOX class probable F420-dependent enzyme